MKEIPVFPDMNPVRTEWGERREPLPIPGLSLSAASDPALASSPSPSTELLESQEFLFLGREEHLPSPASLHIMKRSSSVNLVLAKGITPRQSALDQTQVYSGSR